MRVLDTNVILRYLLADDPEQSPRASRILGAIAAGEINVVLPEAVVLEVVFTLERRFKRPLNAVRDAVRDIVELEGLNVPNKRFLLDALDLHVEQRISIVDAYVALVAMASGTPEVISFDRDFDRIPGLTRVEPV